MDYTHVTMERPQLLQPCFNTEFGLVIYISYFCN